MYIFLKVHLFKLFQSKIINI